MAFFRRHLTFHSSLFALLAMTADAQQPTNAKVKTVEKKWEMAKTKNYGKLKQMADINPSSSTLS